MTDLTGGPVPSRAGSDARRPVPGPPPQVATPEQALGRLAEAETLDVAEHVAVFGDVHRMLQDALGGLDRA